MVQTRHQGARPAGVSYADTQKRERRPAAAPRRRAAPARRARAAVPPPAPAPAPAAPAVERNPAYRDSSMQTDPVEIVEASTKTVELTATTETGSGKRRREEDESSGTSSKRQRGAETPKFLFSARRNRSLLASAPAKATTQHESPFFARVVEPTARQSTPTRASKPREGAKEPETPTPTPQGGQEQRGLFGSVKKLFGFFRGFDDTTAHNEQEQGSASEEQNRETTPEAIQANSPTTPSPLEPDSPTPQPQTNDSRIDTRDQFKRRRYSKTSAGRDDMTPARDDTDRADTDFNPVEASGTNKRKLASMDGEIPGPATGGYGIDDSYLDAENEVDGIEDSQAAVTQPSTPKTKTISQTPLRSAMRQNGNLFGTIGRSAKSVRINPETAVKHVYGQYGHSGEYHGSMFSDPSDASDSSISAADVRNMHSPTTLRNTLRNESPKFRLNEDVVDPNDEFWRPSLANPSPGHFRVPDLDEYDEEEGDGAEDTAVPEQAGEQDQVPPQPSTPRMSHAELPSQISNFTGHTESILMNESAEIRLNKARSDAQKYKPARSSLLSLSEHARSRSSSPPESEGDFTQSQIEVSTPTANDLREADEAETAAQDTPSQPLGREELDNTKVGDDGMTDYQREHQYDEWAANLDWPEPQTYEDAGIASDYIAELVQKNWTERDTRESVEFWDREFEEGLKAAREAAAQGKHLFWVEPGEMFED
ncbi:hypothetical protein HRR78_007707 [Exophiala dermatitidis]|nr:hypothetical protein HRR75_007314 [Exophiala dermatitidis]KAJ4539660.1 hypothetical protein HRR78_007707 [Exophiala dermatitidis]